MTQRSSSPAVPLPDEALIEIGLVGRAHGIKGEVVLQYYADSCDWLDGPLWLGAGESGPVRPVTVASRREHKGQLLVRFVGAEDRTAAEQLRGLSLLLPESLLPDSDEESLYLHDLLGLEVVLHSSGELVGVLAQVDFTGEQELWVIESSDGREILFPAVPEFVDRVDLERRQIRVSPPPGLLELYA